MSIAITIDLPVDPDKTGDFLEFKKTLTSDIIALIEVLDAVEAR